MKTTPAEAYSEKLRDPRWQQMRLRVMEAAGWSCAVCGDNREELHAHHPIYDAGRDPWDYPVVSLQCLCSSCHSMAHMNPDKVVIFAQGILVRRRRPGEPVPVLTG